MASFPVQNRPEQGAEFSSVQIQDRPHLLRSNMGRRYLELEGACRGAAGRYVRDGQAERVASRLDIARNRNPVVAEEIVPWRLAPLRLFAKLWGPGDAAVNIANLCAAQQLYCVTVAGALIAKVLYLNIDIHRLPRLERVIVAPRFINSEATHALA